MTPEIYLQKIARLNLTQEEAGILLGHSARTGQRWAADGPPLTVAALLILVTDRKELERVLAKAGR